MARQLSRTFPLVDVATIIAVNMTAAPAAASPGGSDAVFGALLQAISAAPAAMPAVPSTGAFMPGFPAASLIQNTGASDPVSGPAANSATTQPNIAIDPSAIVAANMNACSVPVAPAAGQSTLGVTADANAIAQPSPGVTTNPAVIAAANTASQDVPADTGAAVAAMTAAATNSTDAQEAETDTTNAVVQPVPPAWSPPVTASHSTGSSKTAATTSQSSQGAVNLGALVQLAQSMPAPQRAVTPAPNADDSEIPASDPADDSSDDSATTDADPTMALFAPLWTPQPAPVATASTPAADQTIAAAASQPAGNNIPGPTDAVAPPQQNTADATPSSAPQAGQQAGQQTGQQTGQTAAPDGKPTGPQADQAAALNAAASLAAARAPVNTDVKASAKTDAKTDLKTKTAVKPTTAADKLANAANAAPQGNTATTPSANSPATSSSTSTAASSGQPATATPADPSASPHDAIPSAPQAHVAVAPHNTNNDVAQQIAQGTIQPPTAQAPQPITAEVQVAGHSQHTTDTPTAFDKLGITIAAKSLEGLHQFDIRLDPAELGRVQVQLTVDNSGQAQANLVVDNPKTLDLLQRDAASLNRALTDAGLNLSGSGLNFSLREQQRDSGSGQQRSRGRGLSVSAAVAANASAARSASGSYAPNSVRLDIRV